MSHSSLQLEVVAAAPRESRRFVSQRRLLTRAVTEPAQIGFARASTLSYLRRRARLGWSSRQSSKAVSTSKADTRARADEPPSRDSADSTRGRYRIGPCIGAGGMGQVHLAMTLGAAGFSRLVAIKRLHSEYARDPRMRARFELEIRLSARIVHPNVVQVLDVFESGDDLMFVMEYVPGDTLRSLRRSEGAPSAARVPLPIATGILVPALHGLHAAHETRDADGQRLRLVHRDFSPDNVMIGPDGEVKVLDFGVAKAAAEAQTTKPGSITGKLSYMSPEQALGLSLDARSDVFAAGTVLWEVLVGERLFRAENESAAAILGRVLHGEIVPPRRLQPDIPEELNRAVMRALDRNVEGRFESAFEFAAALQAAVPAAPAFQVGQWLQKRCAKSLQERAAAAERFRAMLSGREPLELTSALAHDYPATESSAANGDTFGDLPLSQSISTIRSEQRVKPANSRGAIAALVVAAGVLSASAFWWQRGTTRAPASSAAASSTQPSAAGAVATSVAAPSVLVASVPAPSAAPAEAAVSARASSSSLPSARPARELRSTRAPAARPRPSSSRNCSPPTYVDGEGIRHFKPECL